MTHSTTGACKQVRAQTLGIALVPVELILAGMAQVCQLP